MSETSKLSPQVEGISLIWIVVKDLNQAITFYTQVVGMQLMEHHEEHKWAELAGVSGARLGIAEENPNMETKAGSNAVVAINVKDIDVSRDAMVQMGARLIGEVIEIPHHVKMQTVQDQDGNLFQITQRLDSKYS